MRQRCDDRRLDIAEWRYSGHGRRRRRRNTDFIVEDQRLVGVHQCLRISDPADLLRLIPEELPSPFHTGKGAILRALVHLTRRLGRGFRDLDVRRHPELGLFPSEQHSRKAMRRVALKLIGRPAHLTAAVAAAALAVTSTLVLRKVVAGFGLPIAPLTRDLILAVPVIFVCCVFGLWLLNRRISKLLRYELLDCGVPVCVQCGYPLIGLPGPECPECGRVFDAHVQRLLETDAQPASE